MEFYQANQQDVEGVADLFDRYRQFYQQPASNTDAYRFIKERIVNGDSIIFVAKKEMEYIGFVQLYPTYSSIAMKKAWILNDLYVVEKERRVGVAQQLLNLAMNLGQQTDAAYITLETAPMNSGAKQLYEKNGFVCDTAFEHHTLSFTSK
ncbi:GNAT family N-acetyltransferase [Bacillus sp. FJAT-50079]|uniref:GNAT family N-acetyltransferase n=1 Tax=Bacillus sp. FJAT-50079 TaxID=2833577 RepID=UPI001BC9D497|nr:GNAT family N-acetyltransferase [Bacillus sp. FJAT-50079]MBS4210196.1 GNAT family N-acetyltransferase [Bacillus sp. FJAT-50079]